MNNGYEELLNLLVEIEQEKTNPIKKKKSKKAQDINLRPKLYLEPHIKVGAILLPLSGKKIYNDALKTATMYWSEDEGKIIIKVNLPEYVTEKTDEGTYLKQVGILTTVKKYSKKNADLAWKFWQGIPKLKGNIQSRNQLTVSIQKEEVVSMPNRYNPFNFYKGSTVVRALADRNNNYIAILPEGDGYRTVVKFMIEIVPGSDKLPTYQYSGTVTTNLHKQETFHPKKGCILVDAQIDILATTLGQNHFRQKLNKALQELGSSYSIYPTN